jgi:hypothetical protein
MKYINVYYPSCDDSCERAFGFRVVLLWSFWSFLFLALALVASRREIDRANGQAPGDHALVI